MYFTLILHQDSESVFVRVSLSLIVKLIVRLYKQLLINYWEKKKMLVYTILNLLTRELIKYDYNCLSKQCVFLESVFKIYNYDTSSINNKGNVTTSLTLGFQVSQVLVTSVLQTILETHKTKEKDGFSVLFRFVYLNLFPVHQRLTSLQNNCHVNRELVVS